MRKKNALNRFGDKFSGEKFGKSLIFCMIFLVFFMAQSVSAQAVMTSNKNEYQMSDVIVITFDPPIGAGEHAVWICPCDWIDVTALTEPFCKRLDLDVNPGGQITTIMFYRARSHGNPCECFDIIYDANNNGAYVPAEGDLKDDSDIINACKNCQPVGNQAGFHIIADKHKAPLFTPIGFLILIVFLIICSIVTIKKKSK